MLSLVSHHHTLIHMNTGHQCFRDQANIALLMPLKVADHHLLLSNHALQKTWQRNTIVKWIWLIGEEMNTTIRIVFTQCLGGCRPRYAIAYNDIPSFVYRQISTPWLLNSR